MRRWKGAPLELAEVERLAALPTPAELAVLGLSEQTPAQLSSCRRFLRKSRNRLAENENVDRLADGLLIHPGGLGTQGRQARFKLTPAQTGQD